MTMATERFDAVVVGAGLAGLQTARLLARRGARVLLADRKASVDSAVHTTGIFVRRTLEDFDFPAGSLGPPVRHVVLHSPAGRSLALESPREEFRVGRMGVLYRAYLADFLGAGGEWSPATRFAGAEEDASGSVVRLETGPRTRVVHARLVIGADGATSRVARSLGLDANDEWIVGVEEVWRGASAGGPPRFHCFLDPELAPGYIAWVVDDGEEVHLGTGGYAARFRPLEALERLRPRAERLVDFSRAERVESRGGRIPVGGVLRRIACARGLVVGDAAGAVSPLTAGGLDPCLRLSSLAARVAGDFLETGDPASLAPYDGGRFRAHFRTRIALRRLLTGIRSPALLEAGFVAMRAAPLRALAEGVFFGRGSFPDVEVGGDSGDGARGRRIAGGGDAGRGGQGWVAGLDLQPEGVA